MGECRSKKFGCKLGALQRVFPKPAFLRHGGDALISQPNAPGSLDIVYGK